LIIKYVKKNNLYHSSVIILDLCTSPEGAAMALNKIKAD
jgi:hypothetical protein